MMFKTVTFYVSWEGAVTQYRYFDQIEKTKISVVVMRGVV